MSDGHEKLREELGGATGAYLFLNVGRVRGLLEDRDRLAASLESRAEPPTATPLGGYTRVKVNGESAAEPVVGTPDELVAMGAIESFRDAENAAKAHWTIPSERNAGGEWVTAWGTRVDEAVRNSETWPLGYNPDVDTTIASLGLGHWSCGSADSNGAWVRRDGQWCFPKAFVADELEAFDRRHPISLRPADAFAGIDCLAARREARKGDLDTIEVDEVEPFDEFAEAEPWTAKDTEIVRSILDSPPGPAASDPVNAPAHYTCHSIQPIDVIESWGLGFLTGNCVKYVSRHEHKGNPLEDLRKARWYLDREIARREAQP